eukprot:SAG11_NODE_19798_length_458_cov_2.036212_2_plen_60_part_00
MLSFYFNTRRQRTELKDHHHGIVEDSYYVDRSGEGLHHRQEIFCGAAVLASSNRFFKFH